MSDDFFVGYRPMPPALRRFALAVGGALLALVLLGAASIARSTAPAEGAPGADGDQTVEGLLVTEPYGMIWIADGAAGARPVLLVRGGKFGFIEPTHPLAGRAVRATGLLLRRDGVTMLELAREPEPHPSLDAAALARDVALATRPLGEVTLRGVMEDGKCWLGRMRPGVGQPHRACAQLCVRGGIPPVLVVRTVDGGERALLVASRRGGPLHTQILDLLAEPVEVRGALVRLGTVEVLQTDPGSIARL